MDSIIDRCTWVFLLVFLFVGIFCVKALSQRGRNSKELEDGRVVRVYPYNKSVWWFEAILYGTWNACFIINGFSVAKDVSDRYRDIVVDSLEMGSQQSGLHQSWASYFLFNGRPFDLKDSQYHRFYDALPWLGVVMMIYLVGGSMFQRISRSWLLSQRIFARCCYILVFGLVAGIVIHEAGILKLLFVVLVNFFLIRTIVHSRFHRAAPVIIWGFALLILYVNHRYNGYSWVSILGWSGVNLRLLYWMDSKTDLLPWYSSFNFVALRMISFSMDYWWSVKEKSDNVVQSSTLDEGRWESNNSSRIKEALPDTAYNSIVLYLSYVFYLPLYIAGPIVTFNSFISYLATPQKTYSTVGKIKYALFGFLLPLIMLYVATHFIYASCIVFMGFRISVPEFDAINNTYGTVPLIVSLIDGSKDNKLIVENVFHLIYYSLFYLYLKFLVIWRFFRLWAILDDVEPCENMQRCIANNTSVTDFWRSWHRSFNSWLLRYLYIPLGGSKHGGLRQALSIFVVFTFVSFWHDVSMQLFAWGWLFALFLVPEIVAGKVRKQKSINHLFEKYPLIEEYTRAALCAAATILLMFTNAVGYSLGMNMVSIMSLMMREPGSWLFCAEFFLALTVYSLTNSFIRDTRNEVIGSIKSKKGED